MGDMASYEVFIHRSVGRQETIIIRSVSQNSGCARFHIGLALGVVRSVDASLQKWNAEQG
jgi:hypothetical protein